MKTPLFDWNNLVKNSSSSRKFCGIGIVHQNSPRSKLGTASKRIAVNKEKHSNERKNYRGIAIIIGFGALSAAVYAGMDKEENKQKVAMTKLPAAVQKTIQDRVREELQPKPWKKPKTVNLLRGLSAKVWRRKGRDQGR